MIFLRLYRYFCGKVKVLVLGEFPERILNICAHNGITIWGIRKKEGRLTFYMSARDFLYIRTVIRKSRIRLHILKKTGWPFIYNRYRRRYGLFLGAVLFFAILYFLAGFIWNINISGNEKIKDTEILTALSEIGIREGVKAKNIDAWEKRVELTTKVDGIAWTAINIEGCELTVDLTEANIAENKDYDPCNLVSDSNGKIRSIKVESGKICVSVGEFVSVGKLLVSGIYELNNGNTHLSHSEGEILAEVEENIVLTVPYNQTIDFLSGKTQNRYLLSVFGKKIPLYLGGFRKNFVREDSLMKIKNGNAYLPFYLQKSRFREVKKQEIKLTYDKALDAANKRIERLTKDFEIISNNQQITENNDSITVNYNIKYIKDIAKEEKIIISATN